MKCNSTIAIAIVGLVLMGATARAETCNFNVSSGNWTTDGSWSCGHEPTFADLAVIQSGNTCTMDDAAGEADSLTVEGTATLNVQASKKLSLDGDSADTTITGTVNLQGSASELAFITNDQTMDGTGKVIGAHNGAKISITTGETLVNEGTIEGKLQITGAGDFDNRGTVHVNVAGTLLIDCNSFDDDSTALWKITGSSGAIMQLNLASLTIPVMEGDWVIEDDGTLDVDSVGFQTEGSLTWKGGTIDVVGGGDSIADFGAPPLP